jgi:hypothetical protein
VAFFTGKGKAMKCETCPRCLTEMEHCDAVREPEVNVDHPALWSCDQCELNLDTESLAVWYDGTGEYPAGTSYRTLAAAEEAKAAKVRQQLAEDACRRSSILIASVVAESLGWKDKPAAAINLARDILANGGKL